MLHREAKQSAPWCPGPAAHAVVASVVFTMEVGGVGAMDADAVRVVIVDDYDDIRWLVRMAFERSGNFVVVGEAADGAAGVKLVQSTQPDVVLLDIKMPVMDGVQALARIRRLVPGTPVVMLSAFHATDDPARTAVRLGAAGYIDKGARISDLPDTLRELLAKRVRT
jgi:DNA-binding NarL/FixJ family response regulator